MDRLLPVAWKILSFGNRKLLKKINESSAGSKAAIFTTIGISHFCERARWALDLSPLKDDYLEDRHLPGLHLSATLMVLANLPKISLVWKGKPESLGEQSNSKYFISLHIYFIYHEFTMD